MGDEYDENDFEEDFGDEPDDLEDVDDPEAAGAGGDENVEILNADEAGGEGGEAKSKQERVTTPYMTKYERARVLGTRALQVRAVMLPLWIKVNYVCSLW